MHLRARKKSSKDISLYEPIGTDRECVTEIKLYDIIETDEEDIPERVHLKENIHKLYERENELSQREKLVLKMRYGLYGGRGIHTAGSRPTTGKIPALCIPD